LQGRVAFAWPATDAFYEEVERIMGHAADSYDRVDIRPNFTQPRSSPSALQCSLE
jgi:hypothetical protein